MHALAMTGIVHAVPALHIVNVIHNASTGFIGNGHRRMFMVS